MDGPSAEIGNTLAPAVTASIEGTVEDRMKRFPLAWWAAHWPGLMPGQTKNVKVLYAYKKTGFRGVLLQGKTIPGIGFCPNREEVDEFIDAADAAIRAAEKVKTASSSRARRTPSRRRPPLRDRLVRRSGRR